MDELAAKLKHIDDLPVERDLDALLIRQTANFAWATCSAVAAGGTAGATTT
jgi:hypothetical protein